MKRTFIAPLILFAAAMPACMAATGEAPTPCSPAWFRSVETRVGTGDGHGHGPDPGTDEWKSTIEFRLKIRGRPDVPPRNSVEWCSYIDGLLKDRPDARGAAPAAGASRP